MTDSRAGNSNGNRAYTAVEVLVATTVLAMMSVTLLSFVSFASEVWRRGQQKANLIGFSRIVKDSLQRDLSQTINVISPDPESVGPAMKYELPVRAFGTNSLGLMTVAIEHDTANRILNRRLTTSTFPISDGADVSGSVTRSRYEYVLIRDCASFTVTRPSSWTVDVYLGVQSLPLGGNTSMEASNEATMTFLIPGGG